MAAGLIASLLAWSAGGAALAQDETIGVVGYQRVKVPEAGISVKLPAGWTVETPLRVFDFVLPPEFADEGPAYGREVIYAESGGPTWNWCSVAWYQDFPVPLEAHARLMADRSIDIHPDGIAEVASVELPWGEGLRVDSDRPAVGTYGTVYLFEWGPDRYEIRCWDDTRPDDDYLSIVETFELLEASPGVLDTRSVPGFRRALIPMTDLAVSFPDDWRVETMNQSGAFRIPANFGDGQPVPTITVLSARSEGGSECIAMLFGDVPMSVMDHAMWMAMDYSDPQAGFGATSTPVDLPVGDARRVDLLSPDSGTFNTYLLEAGGERVQLTCNDPEDPPEDDFFSIAETIEVTGGELVGPQPPDEPTPPAIASFDAVSGFASVVEVAEGLLMSADCELALWAEYEDGTFREWLSCWLSSEPVDDPADQGAWPDELVSTSGSACEWVSDYWAVTDDSEVWAEAYELSVTPEGRVFGSSTYGADLLDCTGG